MEHVTVAAHTDIMGSVIDPHRLAGETAVFEHRHAQVIRAGRVDVIVDHLGGDTRYGYVPAPGLTSDPLRRAMRLIDHAHRECQESASLVLAQSVSEIRGAKSGGQIALVMAMEGGSPLLGSLSTLRNLRRLGLRSLGLTHNWRNELGDGCLERSGGGLSHFGKAVVQECNELGIVVDVSHLSAEGVRDVLSISEQPIIASHTNPSAIAPHPHNLDDELLSAIAAHGGLIGVFFLVPYLTQRRNPTAADILRVIQHLINLVGVDHVAIGPDIMENWDQAQFKHVTEGSVTFESVPIQPIDYVYPDGFETVASLPKLRDAMRGLGLSEDEVGSVLGENCLGLWQTVWGS